MRRFKGFTLAELMVALAVIGIIVAIVTPAIMKTRPNRNKMMIKKTYYTAENIVSSLINDSRLYPDKSAYCYVEASDPDRADCAWGFDDDSEVQYEGETFSGSTKFAKLFASKLNVKTVDGVYYYTHDGVKWDLGRTDNWTTNPAPSDANAFENNSGRIQVFVNGQDHSDGTWCTEDSEDCDQYEIQILANGKMRIDPQHTRAIEYVTINTSIKDN